MANLLYLLKSYTNVIIFLYSEVNINKIIFKPAFLYSDCNLYARTKKRFQNRTGFRIALLTLFYLALLLFSRQPAEL